MNSQNGDRELAYKIADFWIGNGFAINWTVSNKGADAKVCTAKWKETPVLAGEPGHVAGQIAHRLTSQNPVVVLRNSNLLGIDVDGGDNLTRFNSFGLPPTLTAQTSAPDRLQLYYRPPTAGLSTPSSPSRAAR